MKKDNKIIDHMKVITLCRRIIKGDERILEFFVLKLKSRRSLPRIKTHLQWFFFHFWIRESSLFPDLQKRHLILQ